MSTLQFAFAPIDKDAFAKITSDLLITKLNGYFLLLINLMITGHLTLTISLKKMPPDFQDITHG